MDGLCRCERLGVIFVIGTGSTALLLFIYLVLLIQSYLRAHRAKHEAETESGTPSSPPNSVMNSNGSEIIDSPPPSPSPFIVISFNTDVEPPNNVSKTIVLDESMQLPRPGDDSCLICDDEYRPHDILTALPRCEHYFHESCIEHWLVRGRSCPICRNEVYGLVRGGLMFAADVSDGEEQSSRYPEP